MKIESHVFDKEHSRTIEKMADGLVLLKIWLSPKRVGMNYHYLFENHKKPPLDIALNPDNHEIEYVSFILQDEKIAVIDSSITIPLLESSLRIFDDKFDDKNVYLKAEGDFIAKIYIRNLYILNKIDFTETVGYKLSESSYILFSNNNFVGFLLKDLSDFEMGTLREAHVL